MNLDVQCMYDYPVFLNFYFHMNMYRYLPGPEESVKTPEATRQGCWEPNTGPLEEQNTPLSHLP